MNERAVVDGGGAGIAVGAGKRQPARSVLSQAALPRHDAGVEASDILLQRQRALAELDIARAGKAADRGVEAGQVRGRAGLHAQQARAEGVVRDPCPRRAFLNGQSARERIVAGEDRRAFAILHHPAAAADRARQHQFIAAVYGQGALAIDMAVDDHVAFDAAACTAIAKLQHAVGYRGGTGVAVVAREHKCAEVGLVQALRAAQFGGDGRGDAPIHADDGRGPVGGGQCYRVPLIR